MGGSLKILNLYKRIGTFLLKDINLEIGKQEYFVILGPSGAGKTVLLQVIAGILKPDRGRILLDDRDVTDLPPEERGIGYVPQNCALFPHLTVYRNIE